jgi:hypothetical protein
MSVRSAYPRYHSFHECSLRLDNHNSLGNYARV